MRNLKGMLIGALICTTVFSCSESKKAKPNPLNEVYSYESRDSIYDALVSDSILSLNQIDTLKKYIKNVPNDKWDETQTYGQILDNARKTEKKRVELSSYIEVTLKKKFPKRYRNGIFLDFMALVKNHHEKEIVKFDATLEFYDNYNEKNNYIHQYYKMSSTGIKN